MIAKEKFRDKPNATFSSIPIEKCASQPAPVLNDLHRRRVVSTAMRFHNNLNIVIEGYQETQQAFDGELAELSAQHLRDIGLADAKQLGGFHLLEAALLQDRVDLEYKLRLDQMLFRIGHADVLEHVAAPGFISLFVAHCFPPLAICSASRKRCRISSMSQRGVCFPLFDFF